MSKENSLLVGDWQVQFDGLTIHNKLQHKDLDAKVMELLLYLVTNRGRVVSRNELLDQLWKNQIVADDVLNVAISNLRKALGDNFKTPIYIKTLPRKGYQLIAQVQEVPTSNRQIRKSWLLPTLIILFIATALWFQFPLNESSLKSPIKPQQPVRLAVLPFDYYSAVKNREYIADGLTEAIINQLVKESSLQVTSRASVMQYKTNKASIKEVVDTLNVEWVLEGSVQLEGDKIQVTAQLINAVTDIHLWSETYQRDFRDLFTIQAELASTITTKLNLSTKKIMINKIPPKAYEHFLQAQFFYYKGEAEKAINAYQQAIDIYPNYAEAYAHLSHSYFSKAYSEDENSNELIDTASSLAITALKIDPNPAYVQLASALTYLYNDYNYQAAGKAFQLAFERNNQDLMILEWYIEYSLITKQFMQAEQLAKHMKTISPLAYNKTRIYEALYYRGDFKAATQEVANKATIISEISRESLYVWTALASENKNALLTHAPLLLKAFKLQQEVIDKFMRLLQETGKNKALTFIIEETPVFSSYDKAKLYAWAGENDKAILLLHTLVVKRNIEVLKLRIEPAFKLLSAEPDYIALLQQLNFE